MRTRLIIGLIIASACMLIPAVNASREQKGLKSGLSGKSTFAHRGASIQPGRYRSPVDVHKVMVDDNAEAPSQARSLGAREIANYGSYSLFAIDEQTLQRAQEEIRKSPGKVDASLSVRDDLNVLLLRSGAIDTTDNSAPGKFLGFGGGSVGVTQSEVSIASADASPLRLIQLVGPVKRAWLQEVEASGVELIAYVPNNGYLIRTDSTSLSRLMTRNQAAVARGEGFIQWEGPFLNDYKIHPALASSISGQNEITVALQLASGNRKEIPGQNAEVKRIEQLASSVMVHPYRVMNFTNMRIRVQPSMIAELATLPSVVNIEPWNPPQLFDERAAQVVAGQLNTDGTSARGPGYSSWLTAHGFSSNFDFAIDVSDTGIDRGFTTADMIHPDFLDSNKQSRVLYARDYTSELDPGDVEGHGTINLSIAGGANMSPDSRDGSGFGFGLGVAPFALLGSSKIFQSNGRFDLIDPFTKLISEAYRDGARVSSNSWGDVSNVYSIDSQEYDLRVRDAAPDQPGNQEVTICFAAGNAGFDKSIGSPGTAKNVISVAASESSRKDGTDGCFVRDSDSDSAMDIAFFSSGGPLEDGRIKPDVTAPGTHIEGAASQHPDFDGSGVCGQSLDQPYFPAGQKMYTWSSGTSHSTPAVAGSAALARQFLINNAEAPTAALIKALLLGTTTYMTGTDAGGNLPHPRQGWGLVDLDRAFDNTPKVFVNQTTTFSDSGQSMVITGEVKDSTKPFRVMLAWSDAPGFSGAAPWVNDLDLEVSINGQTYRGNNFSGEISQPGGNADTKNNVEGVWLPAGTIGTFAVRVRASNIAGDGVPGNADLGDQDFALFVYNGEKKDAPVASIVGVTLSGGSDAFADPGETVSMRLSIGDLSPISMNAPHGTVSTTTTGVSVTSSASDFPTVAQGETVDGASAFTFTVDRSVACATVINFVLDLTSQGLLSRVPFTVRVGKSQPTDFLVDDVESGEAKWTHGSGIKKKKNRVDTWVISSKRVHSGTSSWFTKDPGEKVTDAHLDTLPIQVPADARSLQLVFFHTFEFERGAFDGGVLEISTGGDFEDLGPKILKGGYTGSVFQFTGNPLAGRVAWVEGRLGTFQQVVVDLSSYAGKTVTIRFRIGTDETGKGLGWYIDDVSLRGDRISCTPVGLAERQ